MCHHYQLRLKINPPSVGFAKLLAPPAKDQQSKSFASGGLSRLRRLILVLCAHGLYLTNRVKPSLWQRLLKLKLFSAENVIKTLTYKVVVPGANVPHCPPSNRPLIPHCPSFVMPLHCACYMYICTVFIFTLVCSSVLINTMWSGWCFTKMFVRTVSGNSTCEEFTANWS